MARTQQAPSAPFHEPLQGDNVQRNINVRQDESVVSTSIVVAIILAAALFLGYAVTHYGRVDNPMSEMGTVNPAAGPNDQPDTNTNNAPATNREPTSGVSTNPNSNDATTTGVETPARGVE